MTLRHKKLRCLIGRAVLGVAILGSVAMMGACQDELQGPLASPDLVEIDADYVVHDMEQYITMEGVREAKVLADTALVYKDSSKVHLRVVHLTVFDEQGREIAVVTSRSGVLDTETQQMVARGDAVLTVHEGNRIVESEELHYDPGRERIWSDSASVYREGQTVLRGTAFESDLQFTNVRVENARGRGEVIRF